MKPLHKKILLKLIFDVTLLLVEIMSIYFLGIIFQTYVIIEDFVYSDNFCYIDQITSMLGFLILLFII